MDEPFSTALTYLRDGDSILQALVVGRGDDFYWLRNTSFQSHHPHVQMYFPGIVEGVAPWELVYTAANVFADAHMSHFY